MEFLPFLAPLLTQLVKSWFPDPVQQTQANTQMQQVLNQAAAQQLAAQATETAAKADVIKAELNSGSAIARDWRADFMYLFIFMFANNWVIYPYLHAIFPQIIMLPIPDQAWSLIEVCVGGYLGAHTIEKLSANGAINTTKFFSGLKQAFGKLTQTQVDQVSSLLKDVEADITKSSKD